MLEPFYQDHLSTVYNGNALEVLQAMPDESVQMCMTSPPYWGLRNYAEGANIIWGDDHCEHEWGNILKIAGRHKAEETNPGKTGYVKDRNGMTESAGQFCSQCGAWLGQLGLEPAPELYVEHLMMIFREVKRVLRKDGSFYLNIGDTYVSGKGSCFNPGGGNHSWQSWIDRKPNYPTGRNAPNRMCKTIPPKCMACTPERVLFAMLEDGWILRNKVIWHKRNHMPSSVKDRFTQSWEYLYFFTKSRRYYFNLDSVRRPHLSIQGSGNKERKIPFTHKGNLEHSIPWQPFNLRVRDVKRGKKGTSVQNGELRASDQEIKDYEYPEKIQKHEYADLGAQRPARIKHSGYFGQNGEALVNFSKGKNPGDLWSIAIKPSAISVCPHCETVFPRLLKVCPYCKVEGVVGHFAPYPEALCVDPIKASSRVGDIILDPFAGGGTTGVAAKKLGRQVILIDCVRPYCVMARYKLKKVEYQPEIEGCYSK